MRRSWLIAVQRDLVPLGGDAAHQIGLLRSLVGQQEEGRMRPALAQQVQQPRRDDRLRAVVERQADGGRRLRHAVDRTKRREE